MLTTSQSFRVTLVDHPIDGVVPRPSPTLNAFDVSLLPLIQCHCRLLLSKAVERLEVEIACAKRRIISTAVVGGCMLLGANAGGAYVGVQKARAPNICCRYRNHASSKPIVMPECTANRSRYNAMRSRSHTRRSSIVSVALSAYARSRDQCPRAKHCQSQAHRATDRGVPVAEVHVAMDDGVRQRVVQRGGSDDRRPHFVTPPSQHLRYHFRRLVEATMVILLQISTRTIRLYWSVHRTTHASSVSSRGLV